MVKEKGKRRGCFGKIAAIGIVGLVLVVALGPAVATPFVRRAVEARLAEETGGTASIEELDLSLFGTTTIGGVRVEGPDGEELLVLEHASVKPALLALARGVLDVDLEARGVRVHVAIDEEGNWRVGDLKGTDSSTSGTYPEEEEDAALPDIRGRIDVSDVHLFAHRGASVCELIIAGETEIESLTRAAPAKLTVEVRDPRGPAGRVRLDGELTAASGGLDAGVRPEGTARLTLENLRLDALTPLAMIVAPIDQLAGTLEGTGDFALGPDLDLRASLELVANTLRLREAGTERRLSVERLRIHGSSRPADAGGSLQSLRAEAGEIFLFEYTGRLSPEEADAIEIDGTWTLDGELASLHRLFDDWLPVRAGYTFAGTLSGGGEVGATIREGELAGVRAKLELGTEALAVRDEAGERVPLGELDDPRVKGAVALEVAGGLLTVTDLEVAAGAVRLTGRVDVSGVSDRADARLELRDSSLHLEADLDRLRTDMAVFLELEEVEFGGRVTGDITSRGDEERAEVRGELHASDLVWGHDDAGNARALGSWDSTFDAGWLSAPDRLELNAWRVSGPGLTSEVTGTIEPLSTLEDATLAMKVTLEGALSELVPYLPVEEGVEPTQLAGTLTANLDLGGTASVPVVEGDVKIKGLELDIGVDGERLRWSEPRLDTRIRATYTAETGVLDVARCAVDSATVRGELSGRLLSVEVVDDPEASELAFEDVRGKLAYVPDRLAPILAPWLPGTLSGSEPEPLTIHLDGAVREFDPFTLLLRSKGRAEFGLGRYKVAGFDTTGSLDVALEDEAMNWEGEIAANGGAIVLKSTLDLGEPAEGETPRSTLSVGLSDVGANSELAPLLSLMHPAFAAAQMVEGGEIGGAINCDLELSYDGRLTPELLEGGWEALPKERISGRGTFSIAGAMLRGSPLFTSMLGELGLDPDRSLNVDPIELVIDAGRISYAKPWTWTIDGTETTFTGTLGLDETLALTWNLPIDEKLVARYDFLEPIRGQKIAIPLGGTVRSPRLEWRAALNGLASTLAKDEVNRRLGLGGGGGDENDENDPAALLRKADRLWDAGEKAEAAKLYKRLREKFKVSVVYALNRDRIKERGHWREDG